MGKREGGSSFLWAPVRSKLGWNRKPRTAWEDRRPFLGSRQQGESDGWTRCGPEELQSMHVSPKLKALHSPHKRCRKLKRLSLKLGGPGVCLFHSCWGTCFLRGLERLSVGGGEEGEQGEQDRLE